VKFKQEMQLQETEIGEIPREWKIVYLDELFEFRRGLSYRKNDLSSTPTLIRFVTINDLEKEGGWKRNGEPVYLLEEFKDRIEKKHVLEVGDLLIAITDMSKGFIIGAPLYINEDLRSQGEILVYSMDLVKLQPRRQVNTLFYYYQLSWSKVRKMMKSLARGTNVLHLDLNLAKRIKLAEPPLNEQQRIAEILLTVDKAIENVDNAIARLEKLKKALMRELLTGRIRVREENGKLVFYRETEFQDTEIGEIPKDWKIVKLGNVAKYVKGKKPKNLFEEKIDNDILPYLTAEYMRGLEKPKWCDPKLEKSIIKVSSDDIIMIWDGSYAGHVFIGFEGILASTMVKITPIRDIEKRFLFYYLAMNYKKLRETTIGTGIPHINKKVFEEFPIPLPPVDEQRRIAEILVTIDKTIELHHEEKARLDRLKRGLMDLLLTGRVRVVG